MWPIEYANQKRIEGISRTVAQLLPKTPLRLLDVGGGDGRLACEIAIRHGQLTCEGVDVVVPKACFIPMHCYEGTSIPFAASAFDVVLCADMLHHTESPADLVAEASRVAKRFLVIKDHAADVCWDRWILTAMDWLGNAGAGLPMPFNFLSKTQWETVFAEIPFTISRRVDRLQYWNWPLNKLLDRNFHFVVLLERN